MRSLLALILLALVADVSARADVVSLLKLEITGTLYLNDALGKLDSRPLTNRRIMQLCGPFP